MPSSPHTMTARLHTLLALTLAALPFAAQTKPAPSPEGCGETHNLYGPFDYRTAHPSQRFIVENAHFTKGVENLTKGTTGAFGGDIGYTLAVFPNHPRAISTLERLIDRQKADPPQGADMTLECYYARGMAFVPDDLVFRMLHVSYLIRRNRLDEAHRFLDYVVTQAEDSALTHFNAGMLYFDMKDYDKALVQAHRVMGMGMTRTELRDRLSSVGHWKEPDPVPVAADAAASAPEAPASAASQTSP